LSATVRDNAGNPVAGQTVNFTAAVDGSNGSISPGTAVTDASGTATTQFTSGPLTTANNGVVLEARVAGTAITSQARLTVNSQALFISIAFGNSIGQLDENTYQKSFSVYVTDANGAPAANQRINLSVFPDTFGKGQMGFNGTAWEIDPSTYSSCENEDVNRNGILDPNENDGDTSGPTDNADNQLQPGLPVVVAPGLVTTDANGTAVFNLQYGENFANWVTTTITARAQVGGTESVKTQTYTLLGLSTDFTNANVAPAAAVSPFGTGTCTTVN
jgi:hypothetical protein